MNTPSASPVRAPDYGAAPQWFLDCVSAPTTSHWASAAGARVHCRAWNAADLHKPALLLVHGFLGHSHWWDFVAPFFTEQFRVHAMDFSGMGRSAHRPQYDAEVFVADLHAVLEHITGPAVVVGHSFGGGRTLQAAAAHPGLVPHAVILDSWVRFPDDPPPGADPTVGSSRPFPDYAAARARFRLLPAQPIPSPYTVEHVAFHSLTCAPEGWRWWFDRGLVSAPRVANNASMLAGIQVPVDYVCGEYSAVVPPDRAARIAGSLRQGRGPIVIPESHHHLMLDQPLALVAALRALLAGRCS